MTVSNSLTPNRIFLIWCFVCSAIFFAGPGGKSFSNSFISYVAPLILYISFFSSKIRAPKSNAVKRWAILAFICILLSYVLIGGGLGSVLSNLNFIFLVFIFSRCSFNETDIEFFTKLIRYFTLYLLVYLFFNRYADGYFGGLNANSIGMQGFMCFCFMCICPHKNKAVQLLFLVLTFLVVVLSSSRTSLGALLLFCIVALFFQRECSIRYAKKITALTFVVVISMAVLQTFIYSFYISEWRLFSAAMEYSVENFDKSLLTGREYIWESAWDKLMSSPKNLVFGIGSHFYGNDDFGVGSNFHSSFFTVVVCCGFLGYCVLMKLLHFIVSGNDGSNGCTRIRNYLMPFAFMLLGFFESVLFSGNFAIMFFLFMSFCHSLTKDSKMFFR